MDSFDLKEEREKYINKNNNPLAVRGCNGQNYQSKSNWTEERL